MFCAALSLEPPGPQNDDNRRLTRLCFLLFVASIGYNVCLFQNFEGINYGDRKLRDQMRAGFVDIGRRERKPAAVKAYAPPPPRVGEVFFVVVVELLYCDM